MRIRAPVKLGPRTTLYDMAFEGNRILIEQDLADKAELELGGPLSQTEMEAARRRVLESTMTDFRHNHYVPRWYQERFLPADRRQRELFYLCKEPRTVVDPRGRHHPLPEVESGVSLVGSPFDRQKCYVR